MAHDARQRSDHRVSSILGTIALIALGTSGALKLFNLTEFRESLELWSVVPGQIRTPIAVLLPALELVGFVWGFFIHRQRALWVLLVLLSIMVATSGIQLSVAPPERCGCFGVLEQYVSGLQSGRWLIVKSGSLLAVTAMSLVLGTKESVLARTAIPCMGFDQGRKARRGFTLLEVLWAVVVVGLLLALLAPSLAQSTLAARSARNLANLRANGQILAVYSADWRDSFPSFIDPRAGPPWEVRLSSGEVGFTVPLYFIASLEWQHGIAEQYYDGHARHPVARSIHDLRHVRGGVITFMMPCVFFARPQYWNRATRTGRDQLGATYAYQVVWPSKKILLLDDYFQKNLDVAPSLRSRLPVLATDGHAENTDSARVLHDWLSSDWSTSAPWAYHAGGGDWTPGLHTTDGVRGRDLP